MSARLRLRECATVTVASIPFFIRSSASGLPTIMLRPRMTTCAPNDVDLAFDKQPLTTERRARDKPG